MLNLQQWTVLSLHFPVCIALLIIRNEVWQAAWPELSLDQRPWPHFTICFWTSWMGVHQKHSFLSPIHTPAQALTHMHTPVTKGPLTTHPNPFPDWASWWLHQIYNANVPAVIGVSTLPGKCQKCFCLKRQGFCISLLLPVVSLHLDWLCSNLSNSHSDKGVEPMVICLSFPLQFLVKSLWC